MIGFAVEMREGSLDWWGWRGSVCEEGFVVRGRRPCSDSEGQTLACPWMCSQHGWNLRFEEVLARDKAHTSAIQRPRRWAWEYGPFSSLVQWASPNCASRSLALAWLAEGTPRGKVTVIQKRRWWRETCGDMVRHWVETSHRKMGVCSWSWARAGTEWAALWVVVCFLVSSSLSQEQVDIWERGWTAGRGDEGKKSGVAGTVVIRGLFKTKYMSISYI